MPKARSKNLSFAGLDLALNTIAACSRPYHPREGNEGGF
jgi:hypothetical protein